MTNIKRNENETIKEFNNRFDKIVQGIPQMHQPNEAIILMYYMNAFQGKFIFHLNLDKPKNLEVAKKKVKDSDESWRASRKANSLHPPRAKAEQNPKTSTILASESLESATNLILEEKKKLRIDFTQQNIALQNTMLQVERNQQQNKFTSRNFNNCPSNNGRTPTSLEPTNLVGDFPHFL